MTENQDVPSELACGADTGALLEQALDRPGDPLTDHQRRCVHCSAALAEYSELFGPLRDVVAEVVVPPPDLLEAVLRRVRLLAGSPGWAVLSGPHDGTTRISIDVIVRIVRATVDAVPGVRVSLVGADPSPTVDRPGEVVALRAEAPRPGSGVTVGATGATVAVEVTLAADYGTHLPTLGRTVNGRVRAELLQSFGLRTASSTVHIDDVLAPRR